MKKILVVVDMQNDFINGTLGTKEAEAIVDSVVDKIQSYKGAQIYATRDTHGEDYLDTSEGKALPVVHCVKDTEGWQIHPRIIAELSDAMILDKPTFGSIQLAEMLMLQQKQEEISIELVGLCTDICVVSNALLLKAMMPEVPIAVDASCCAGVTPESHVAALTTMGMCQIEVKGL